MQVGHTLFTDPIGMSANGWRTRPLCADSVEKVLQQILLAMFDRSGICARINDSFYVSASNHYCVKTAPKYSQRSFSTESAISGHPANVCSVPQTVIIFVPAMDLAGDLQAL